MCAHALDELHGRPLATGLSDLALVALAAVGLVGAVGIGLAGLVVVSVQLAPLVAAGAFIVVGIQPRAVRGALPYRHLVRRRVGGVPRVHELLGQRAHGASRRRPRHRGLLRAEHGATTPEHAGARVAPPDRSVSGEQRLADGHVVELTTARSPRRWTPRSPLSLAIVLLAAGFVAVRS